MPVGNYQEPLTQPLAAAEFVRKLGVIFGCARASKELNRLMKFALCNEMYEDWPFDKAFAFTRESGYTGIELAPFTMGTDAFAITGIRRREVRQQADEMRTLHAREKTILETSAVGLLVLDGTGRIRGSWFTWSWRCSPHGNR